MRRETSNWLRFILEELVPPVVKDSALFRVPAARIWGQHIVDLADFRRRAPFVTAEEYEAIYRAHPRVHNQTDNSESCLAKILDNVVGESVCDVGCGTGYLLTRIQNRNGSNLKRLVGVDFVLDDPLLPGIEMLPAKVEALPFADGEFDTVICTHVLEHILDYRLALSELRRVARRRLIIVVPRERETRFTFNPHLNFFAYPETLLRALIPIPAQYECVDIQRDLYYREDRDQIGKGAP
ncbi:MAG: class I SAM-dependent methyltransferase [Panacagrimonas sp.]